jgi:hypothetical protein
MYTNTFSTAGVVYNVQFRSFSGVLLLLLLLLR